MGIAYKVLGQLCPADTNTLHALYTVPAATQTVVSSITMTDVGEVGGACTVSIAINGAVDNIAQYLYGSPTSPAGFSIDPGDTFIATIGITLNAGDVVRVMNVGAVPSEITFQLFGSEIS